MTHGILPSFTPRPHAPRPIAAAFRALYYASPSIAIKCTLELPFSKSTVYIGCKILKTLSVKKDIIDYIIYLECLFKVAVFMLGRSDLRSMGSHRAAFPGMFA